MNDDVSPIVEKIRSCSPKTISHWRSENPEFATVCMEQSDLTLALRQAKGWSSFFIQYLTRERSPAAKFFTATLAHQIYFYNLLGTLCDAIVYRSSYQVGVPISDSLSIIKRVGVSESTARSVIKDSVSAKYCVETYWRKDKRIKLTYISPECLTAWLQNTGSMLFNFVTNSELPEIRQLIAPNQDEFYENVIIELKTAIAVDKDSGKN